MTIVPHQANLKTFAVNGLYTPADFESVLQFLAGNRGTAKFEVTALAFGTDGYVVERFKAYSPFRDYSSYPESNSNPSTVKEELAQQIATKFDGQIRVEAVFEIRGSVLERYALSFSHDA